MIFLLNSILENYLSFYSFDQIHSHIISSMNNNHLVSSRNNNHLISSRNNNYLISNKYSLYCYLYFSDNYFWLLIRTFREKVVYLLIYIVSNKLLWNSDSFWVYWWFFFLEWLRLFCWLFLFILIVILRIFVLNDK